jgi:hypothetical protein
MANLDSVFGSYGTITTTDASGTYYPINWDSTGMSYYQGNKFDIGRQQQWQQWNDGFPLKLGGAENKAKSFLEKLREEIDEWIKL